VGIDVNVNGGGEWLPEGFEARARAANRGLLVHGWAPQVSILAHGSTGAFLSHCGWNSVLESLTHGVPIVGWPLSAEQFYNVKTLAEEWGVCVEVARGNLERSAVESCKVAEGIEKMMGAEVRRRVAEVQEVMKRAWAEDGASSRAALQEFLAAMRLH
jgi:UDP:flavonoid glycosyltransferase YjiC (YdhE family)